MYAVATLHTLLDIASFSSAFTLFPMLGPREREGVGFIHFAYYKRSQFPTEYGLNNICHEQRYCIIFEEQHGIIA